MEGADDDSSKDDSLADFKSPKLKPVARVTHKPKILNEKRAKKTNKTKRQKPEASRRCRNEDPVQPSIESSFFKATTLSNGDEGHTCPLCMKYFSDAGLGTAHSKNCAAKNNVSTKKLLTAVALQKRQANERLAIGLPAGPFVQPKNKTPRRPREPISNLDPELQLALALSKSLQENEREQEFEEALLLDAEYRGGKPTIEMTSAQRKQTLKNFGFSTDKPSAPGIPAGPLKSRRKKHLGPTVLQTRSQESRDRLLSDKIAEILMGNEAITQLSQRANSEQVETPATVLRSRLLNEIHRTTERLWDSARLSTEVTNFYVENLSPAVTPDANRQPEVSASQNADASKPDEENCPSNGNPSKIVEKIVTAISPASSRRATEMATSSAIETRSVHVTDRQYRNTLPADWSSILNVSSMSDLVIIVKSNHIWAHKLVLHVRCSDILLHCEPNNDTKYAHVKECVCWPDVDFLIATAFLEFVYSGIIDKNEYIFDDNRALAGVRRLARKYRLKDLFDYLRKRKAEIGIRRDVESSKEARSESIVVDVCEIDSEIADSREHRVRRTRSDEDRENRYERDKNEDVHSGDEMIGGNRSKTGRIAEIHVSEDASQKNRLETCKSQETHLPDDLSQVNRLKIDKTKEILTPDLTIRENQQRASKLEENASEDSQMEKPIEVSPIPATSGFRVEDESETEAMDVATISSSDRASTMSPDLFDETMQRSSRTDEESSDSPEVSQESTAENSNLKLLAQLIENDVSSSERSSQGSTLILSSKTREENPTILADLEDSRSSENVGDLEVSTPVKRVDEHASKSPHHTETPRSRGVEDARLECPAQPKAKSNLSLFIEKVQKINSKAASDSCTDEESLASGLDRRRFRNPFNLNSASNPSTPSDGKANENVHEHDSRCKDEVNRRENSPESVSSVNDTICTDDEDVSMYSNYRRANKHNNSIANYREMLKKLHNKVSQVENENSENEMSTADVAIDLTQESDEDPPASSSSSVNPPKSRAAINRILDTDSNDSSMPNDHGPARLDSSQDGKVIENREEKSPSPMTRVLERDAEKQTESDSSDEALNKVAEPSNGPLNSLVLSDLDVFEIDEEILLPNSLKTWENASSSLRSISAMSTAKSSNSRGRDGNANEPNDDHPRRIENIEACLNVVSSGETKSPQHSSDYPDSDVFVINDEALTQILKHSEKSTHLRSSGRSETSRDAAKSNGTEAKSAESSSDEEASPRDNSFRRRKRTESSPEYPYTNLSRKSEIFTESLENLDNSPNRRQSRSSRGSPGPKDTKEQQEKYKESFNSTKSSPRDPSNSHFSYDFPEVDFFENSHEIFTQSFKTTDEPYRATSPLIERTSGPRSIILLSSSPELDGNLGELLKTDDRDANKENSIERSASPVEPRPDHLDDRYSPLYHEKLLTPRAGTSSRDRDSSHSVKKLMTRSISMPESTLTSCNSRKRTRTPRKPAKAAMSRELTPPRNYDAMDTPELKRELAKYGIKPQKRKRARQLLNHIYDELHQGIGTAGSRESSTNEIVEEDNLEGPPSKKIGKISDRNSNDSDSDRDFALSQESTASQDSIIPEEMEFPDADVSPKGTAGPSGIKEAFVGLLKADKKLHTKVLTYEPLPFEALHSILKAQGLKCKPNDLMDFLDEECITFQMAAQSAKSRTKKNRGRNGSKRKDKNKAKENL